jgi:hypothetical protein
LADIVLPYDPADGATLVPDNLNKDLYETPNNLGVGQYSLYETSNGRIEFANFKAGFKVRSHMIRPWQVGRADTAGATKRLDFFQDAWQKDSVFYGVAGANITFYQHYDCTIALFLASLYVSLWRQRGASTGQGTWADAPDVIVKMFIDGVAVEHTQRPLPQTIYYSTTTSYGGYDYHFAREERLTRQFNLHHTKIVNGDSGNQTQQLTAGWHTVGLFVYVAQNTGVEELDLDGGGIGAFYPKMNAQAMHRLTAYVRQVDAIRLL